jgi:hypothetical protein
VNVVENQFKWNESEGNLYLNNLRVVVGDHAIQRFNQRLRYLPTNISFCSDRKRILTLLAESEVEVLHRDILEERLRRHSDPAEYFFHSASKLRFVLILKIKSDTSFYVVKTIERQGMFYSRKVYRGASHEEERFDHFQRAVDRDSLKRERRALRGILKSSVA